MATVSQQKAAKEYGKTRGYAGNQGGWIYRNGQVVGQGWAEVYHLNRLNILNELTRQITAFDSFDALIRAAAHNYTPTLRTRNERGHLQWRVCALADAYDSAMHTRGDTRRAYRE